MKIIITFLLALFSFNFSFSQIEKNDHRLDKEYKACCNKKHGDYGALYCAIDLGKEWDKEMNKYYWGLMNVLDKTAQNDLKVAQRQWLKYRDLEYKFSNSLHDMDGTMYLRMRAYRNMRIVRTRALELKSYYWVRTEEDEPKNYESKTAQSVIQQSKYSSILPTPDSNFIRKLRGTELIDASIIEVYIKKYFSVTKEKAITERAKGNPEMDEGQACRFRTEYGKKIAIEEDYGCNSYNQTTIIEFNNYSLSEVKRILKILLPYEYIPLKDRVNSDKPEGWNENYTYYASDDMCSMSIYKESDKIIVTYGCSC